MALVVFTGGARSGKSAVAQRLAARRVLDGLDVVVAVFGRAEGDPEFDGRIERHRADRPKGFTTLEAADSLTWLEDVDDDALLVVDCLGTLLGRVLEEEWTRVASTSLASAPADALPEGFERAVEKRTRVIVDALLARTGHAIVVTNEVGDGVVPSHASGRLFRDLMGRCNRRLVDASDAAYLCVAGRLVELTGLRRDVSWPED